MLAKIQVSKTITRKWSQKRNVQWLALWCGCIEPWSSNKDPFMSLSRHLHTFTTSLLWHVPYVLPCYNLTYVCFYHIIVIGICFVMSSLCHAFYLVIVMTSIRICIFIFACNHYDTSLSSSRWKFRVSCIIVHFFSEKIMLCAWKIQ